MGAMHQLRAFADPRICVVTGASGTGKSTVGHALAARLSWPFMEGDDLHPRENISKMRSGSPLTDADRAPWLGRVRNWIAGQLESGMPGIITCSALKRRYRDDLRAGLPGISFVVLDADRNGLRQRLSERSGHFMPASLLESQLADYERFGADEPGITVPSHLGLGRQIDMIVATLRLR